MHPVLWETLVVALTTPILYAFVTTFPLTTAFVIAADLIKN